MDKKVIIDGTHNRYLIKKVNHEKLPEKKNTLESFVFHDWIGKNKAYPRLSDF